MSAAMTLLALLTFGSLLFLNSSQSLKSLKFVAEWKEVEFAFPSGSAKQSAISQGKYISGNSVPIDIDVHYKDEGTRIFVTVPRFVPGIPVTFGVMSTNQSGPGGPLIIPYPDYSWHSSHGIDCAGLTSVFRVAIDECERLWILDSGRIGDDQYCQPQILGFDLKSDRLIHRYRFPAKQYHPGMSLFVTPIVDVRNPPPGTCSNTMIYIADVTGFGLLVFDLARNKSWRVQNKYFYPYPNFGTFTIAGESFDLMDGVLGLALSPKNPDRSAINSIYGSPPVYSGSSERQLYFHALASISENSVPLRLIDNSTIWENNIEAEPRSFVALGSRGTQSAAEAMDRNGNLYFGLMNPIAIACWNSKTPYSRENMKIVAQNDATLQFASGLKVIMNKRGKEELWVSTCRFQKLMTGSIKKTEVNFRIQALAIDELLNGNTLCSSSGVSTNSYTYPTYGSYS